MNSQSNNQNQSATTAGNNTDANALFPERARLQVLVEDYVRAGWSVTHQTGIEATLKLRDKTTRVYLDAQNEIQVEGERLVGVPLDPRLRMWGILLLMMVTAFVVASLLGFFR